MALPYTPVNNPKVSEDQDVVVNIQSDFEEPQVSNRVSKIRKALVANAQLVVIVVSVLLGFVIGILIHSAVQQSTDPSTKKLIMYIKFPGELFVRMLRMIIIPLTISSIVVALAEIDAGSAGKLGKRTFLYYFTTTVFATILGIVLMKIIKPGEGGGSLETDKESESNHQVTALDSFFDLLRNLIPQNLVKAAFKSTQTNYVGKTVNFLRKNKAIPKSNEDVANLLKENTIVPWSIINGNNVTIITNDMEYTFSGTVERDGTNFLGLIMFSVALGIVLRKLGEDGRPLLDFCRTWLHVVMMLVSWIMWMAPLGILCLIAGSLADVEDILKTFKDLGLFVAVNFVGCFMQAFIVYPLLYILMVRKNPFVYLSGIFPAMITAFGTSSSSATLPVTIRCCTQNNKVDPRVAQFCLPIGATCNMDGGALYFAVVVLFIANLERISLNFGEIILTCLVAVFVSAGASGIPSSGLTYTILCLEAVGIPTTFVGLIFAIDWMIDRVATVNNVMGDAYGAGIINHLSTDLHQILDDEPNSNVKHDNSYECSFHEGENEMANETRF